LHGLAIADSLQERLRWSEYFCSFLLGLLIGSEQS
jgi:hypothetical protein